jgi:hypothetical protein
MRLKIKGAKVNMASFGAEFGTTCSETRRLIAAAVQIYRDARRGKLDKLIREYGHLVNIPAAVLTYNYSVVPTMTDVIDATHALIDRTNRPLTHRYVVNVSEKKAETSTELDYSWKTTKHAVAYVQYTPGESGGIELGNPAEWAWEAIPFSFIVDQAFSIGDWLSSLDALQGVQALSGTVSTKHEYVSTYKPQGFDVMTPAIYRYRDYRRAWFQDISIPPLPTYKPSRSLKAVVNDLSLLAVLRSRK